MYIKYEVPFYRRSKFDNKKVLYGRVIQKQELKNTKITIYKVIYVNYYGYIDLLENNEIKQLNIIDKIKLLFMKK